MNTLPGVEKANLQTGNLIWNSVTRQVSLHGATIKLPRRVAECLGILIEARGALVSKEELQNRIWSGAAREESSLAQAVAALRKAIDPAPGGGSYIDTVARYGYRIALPVVELPPDSPAPSSRPPGGSLRWLWIAAATLAAVSLLAASAFWWQRSQRRLQAETSVMEAISILRSGRPNDGGRARTIIDAALQLWPDLPLARAAHAELAARYGKQPFLPAIELARRAHAADPSCGECQAVLGFILMTRAWAWEESGRHLRAVVSRDPVSPQWRIWYAQWLAIAGPLPEAEQAARAAVAQEPSHPHARALLASILYMQERYQDAEQEATTAIAIDGRHVPGHYWLQRIRMATNRDEAALLSRFYAVSSWDTASQAHDQQFHQRLVRLLKQKGRPAVVAELLAEVNEGPTKDTNRYQRATYRAWISDDEGALDELTAGAESKPYFMIYTPRDPAFARLRTNPRFTEVVRKLGLLASLPKS